MPAIAVLALMGCGDDGGSTLEDGTGSTGSVGDGDSMSGADEGSEDNSTDDAPVTPEAVCGDSTVEGDEECDDGNAVDGDGCNVDCVTSGSIRWTLEWDGAASDLSTPKIVVAGDRAIAHVELEWEQGGDWARQTLFHVVDRDGVEHATLAEPVSPSVEYLHPLDVAGFQSGEFGVLRLTFADPSPVLTRYDAGGALLDAIPIVVEGNPSGIVPQPGRFAIASRAVGGDEAWLTGFDADGAAQWQKPARHASSIATTPDGSIGMRWNDSTAELPYGLAAYDPLGEPLFEATIGDDSVISEIVGGVDGFWVMVWGAQSRLTHFGLDGTSTDVATVEGAGFQITAMPDGDATVVYSAGDIEYVARIGYDGTTRWTTQMPDGIEVWNLAAGPDGFVWVIGQDDYDVDVAARSYLWGIAP